MVKSSNDKYKGIRIPEELKNAAIKEIKSNKKIQDMGIHTVGGWATYLIRRELDRYCKDTNSKS